MDYKNLALLVISVAMALLVPIMIYGHSFNSVAFEREFYKKEFLEYGVYNTFQDYDVDNINNEVLNYLKGEKNNALIENNFFNEREKAHLLDVKNLVHKELNIYYVSIILFLILSASLVFLLGFDPKVILQRFLLILLFGSILALVIAFLLFVISKTDFGFAFYLLHKTFFPVGTYTFNPEFERIVVLYPESLFSDAFAKIISKTILSSAIVFLVSFAVLFRFFKGKFLQIFSAKFRRQT
ncbi:DUF1461 domain-containing protein [Candidatus Woesearchaeota archaeon]|nr:DUF1461 domain-containing protein [Candidatus Woesearchaeota archaeon]